MPGGGVESCAGGSGLAVCQGGLAVCLGGACRVLGGSSFVPGGVWLCARWVLSVCQGGSSKQVILTPERGDGPSDLSKKSAYRKFGNEGEGELSVIDASLW